MFLLILTSLKSVNFILTEPEINIDDLDLSFSTLYTFRMTFVVQSEWLI